MIQKIKNENGSMGKIFKINDIAKLNQSTITSNDNYEFINYLDTSNITKGKIENWQLLNGNFPSRAKRKIIKNTIIYSTVRPNQEHYGFFENIEKKNSIVSTGFTTIDVVSEYVYSKYLYFLLNQSWVTNYLQTIAENSVSAYPSINPSDIGNIKFNFPPLPTQQKIASILSALDDKIELNHKINENLEQQAKLLYDYWFVQNRDENWEVKTIGDYAEVVKGDLITAKTVRQGNIKVVAAGINYSYLHSEHNRLKNTITISGSGANAGFINFWREPIFASDCITVRGNSDIETILLLYYLKSVQTHILKQAKGSAQPHVYPSDIKILNYVIPPKQILNEFENIFISINDRIANNLHQNQQLSTLRDFLLPMLMNGQVRVE